MGIGKFTFYDAHRTILASMSQKHENMRQIDQPSHRDLSRPHGGPAHLLFRFYGMLLDT